MKILVVTDLYPILENEKNTPKTIYDFVKGWQSLGHEVSVIKPNFLLNSIIRKKPLYPTGIYDNVENINYFLPFCGKIRKKIKTELNPDIVIAHMPSGIIFANKLGLPFIAAVHCSDIEVLTNPVYSFYFKTELENGYKNALKISCRSHVLQKKFLELYPQYKEKTFVAYSGIEENIIIDRVWQKRDKYRILTCGQLIKRKNIDKVILACNEINNIELTIIGDGKEKKYLRRLSNKVNFTGQLEHENVLNLMRHSDIFILPSRNETFGMVYLEAMASGCITVGLSNDGLDGIIIDSQNGYLTEVNNIKQTLIKIINSDNQNEILQSAHNTILNYTKIKACENYLKHFENIA